jgi:hypothetical protein
MDTLTQTHALPSPKQQFNLTTNQPYLHGKMKRNRKNGKKKKLHPARALCPAAASPILPSRP